jgi:peroxiredoxin
MMSDADVIDVGSLAPDFTLTSASGEQISLSSYRGEHHVVLFFMREFI